MISCLAFTKHSVSFSYFFYFSYPHPRTFFSLLLERGKRQRDNMDVRGKHQHRLVATQTRLDCGWHAPGLGLCTSRPGMNPQFRYVFQPGIEPATFEFGPRLPPAELHQPGQLLCHYYINRFTELIERKMKGVKKSK